MRLSKRPISPPPEPVEEEDPSSESDGIEKRDPSQAKKRKISDLQRTPPRSDAGSESEVRVSRRASSRTPSGAARKRKSSSRVFGEEDEVCILNHIIEFRKENGVDPIADMDGFHKYVSGDLVAEITKTQLYEKIRRFRNKFFKNLKMFENGENVVFDKAHDDTIFDLSTKIWGDGVEEKGNGNGVTEDVKSKKSGKDGNLGSVTSPRKSKKAVPVLDEVNDGDDGGMENGGDESEKVNGVVKKSDRKSKKKSKRAKDGNLAASPGKQVNVQNSSAVLEEGRRDGVDFEEEYPYTVQAYATMASRGVITTEQAGFLKANLSAAGNATREFEEKWKELLEKETEIAVQKLEVFTHHSRQVLDGMNK